MKKIKFTSNRAWVNEQSDSCPKPIIKTIPDWFRKADRFAVNPANKEFWKNPENGGKIPTWKSCPAIFDIMGTGYALRTPCDIEFYLEDKVIKAKVLNDIYQDFIFSRDPMPQFKHPDGYQKHHFAWWADWAIEVPEGYSILYSHPFNRFELPFMSTSGIIDNDKVNFLGTIPFFIKEGWTGIISAGTPYMQMIPFKRENWESEISVEKPEELYSKNMKNSIRYRVKNGGVYKNEVWERRTYE